MCSSLCLYDERDSLRDRKTLGRSGDQKEQLPDSLLVIYPCHISRLLYFWNKDLRGLLPPESSGGYKVQALHTRDDW